MKRKGNYDFKKRKMYEQIQKSEISEKRHDLKQRQQKMRRSHGFRKEIDLKETISTDI